LAANRRANFSFVPMALEEQAAKDVLGNPGSKLHDEAAELWVNSYATGPLRHVATNIG
jgi:hypothetical protein